MLNARLAIAAERAEELLEVFKIIVFSLVALVLAPYTLIALGGIGVGLYRQLTGKEKRDA